MQAYSRHYKLGGSSQKMLFSSSGPKVSFPGLKLIASQTQNDHTLPKECVIAFHINVVEGHVNIQTPVLSSVKVVDDKAQDAHARDLRKSKSALTKQADGIRSDIEVRSISMSLNLWC